MSCRDVQQNLHDYIEGTLSDEKRQVVDIHIQDCADCRKAFTEMKNAINISQQLDELEPPPFLANRIMAHVREEAQSRATIFQWLMFPIRIPAGVLAAGIILLTSIYIYHAWESLDEKPERTLVTQTDRLAPPDRSSEALVGQRGQSTDDFTVSDRQTGGLPDISELRDSLLGRMGDVAFTISAENLQTTARKIIQHLLQTGGVIIKAEMLEGEYWISADIKAYMRDDLLAKLKSIGKVEIVGDRQTTDEMLRADIRIIEDDSSP